ncbi:MAG: hypothetical protein ACT4P6_15920 [Gemmatimonadaceae bacterium]
MIRLTLSTALLLSMVAVTTPATASAQNISTQTVVADDTTVTAANRLDAKQVGITRGALVEHARRVETAPARATAALAQSRVRRGQTLMIVGGAAFLAGLIIGDDVGTAIAVGGAIVGIYGLYLWAQTQ